LHLTGQKRHGGGISYAKAALNSGGMVAAVNGCSEWFAMPRAEAQSCRTRADGKAIILIKSNTYMYTAGSPRNADVRITPP
jgi:hypothetical protein